MSDRRVTFTRVSDIKPSAYRRGDWGAWRLDAASYELLIDVERFDYSVDLERCCSSAEVLDVIMQVDAKQITTPEIVAGLVAAVDDVLDPQATLCSSGQDLHLTPAQIRARVDAYAKATRRGAED